MIGEFVVSVSGIAVGSSSSCRAVVGPASAAAKRLGPIALVKPGRQDDRYRRQPLSRTAGEGAERSEAGEGNCDEAVLAPSPQPSPPMGERESLFSCRTICAPIPKA